jgi:uroporphyrin-III C-methyltransferase
VVARLKGGDPFVFGRGGEEAEFLGARGVAVEIVPGLTAGIAIPASLGIPVTHRGVARGVTFLTGHASGDAEPDWRALVQSRATLVVYMGLQRLEHIARRLMAAGMSNVTPAAVIAHGTLPGERCVIAPLGGIAVAADAAALDSPALIVVGEVVAMGARRTSRADSCGYATAQRSREAAR